MATNGDAEHFHDSDVLNEGPPDGPVPEPVDAPARQSAEKPLPSPTEAQATNAAPAVDDVLYSDIGVNTLLTRLKQSVTSAREFADFLKKRSFLEEDHAKGLKKLCKLQTEAIHRPDARQGSFVRQFDQVMRLNERMADEGMQFALSLHQMHEDLNELSNNMERGRKHWKAQGLTAETKVQDAERLLDKAKAKYDSLAEDYDRLRTGDKVGGKFGIRGPKSHAQQEEDTQRKLQAADADYQAKVQSAQSLRQALVSSQRPEAVKAIQELIHECDSGVTLQLQKFASFNEKLLLGCGILISPLPGADGQTASQAGLRDIVSQIDNEKDFQNYFNSYRSKIPSRPAEIKYEKHPSFQPGPQAQQPPSLSARPPQQPPQLSAPSFEQQPPAFPLGGQAPQLPDPVPRDRDDGPTFQPYGESRGNSSPSQLRNDRGFAGPLPPSQQQPPYPGAPYERNNYQPPHSPTGTGRGPPPPQLQQPPPPQMYGGQSSGVTYNQPPVRPVFGVSLDELFARDGSPVPIVVYQCLQAVDLFGLDMEGIYRVPGTATHIQSLVKAFDHDSSKVDLRNPEAFFHDVNSVAGLLKQFLRDLPDPLLTSEHYGELIEAARIEDDTVRRDSLHAIINALPDPNYATLRSLSLHLHRVQEHSHANRMSTSNLAICFAPSLMGTHRGPMSDAALQARVVDTILVNALQIFDED